MNRSTTCTPRITLLAGGVGAARFLRGLIEVVPPDRLTVVVNVGDDDTFYGLHVSPDLDTIVYTLAGLSPRGRGWGIRRDGHRMSDALSRYYGSAWFAIGDHDLATHIFRTDLLSRGLPLSQVTRVITDKLGVQQAVLPATDDVLRTIIVTREGPLPFQDYLVRRKARPAVLGIRYRGARAAHPAPGVVKAITQADVLLIAPSNPLVSIHPILAVPAIRQAVRRRRGRCVAISPLVGGRAVKGPLAAMLRQLGLPASTETVARTYRAYASCLLVAPGDSPPHWTRQVPVIIEHPLLLARPEAARRLAAFAIASCPRE